MSAWFPPRHVPGVLLMHVNLELFPDELVPATPSRCPLELLGLLDWAIGQELLPKDADAGDLHQWCMAAGLSAPAWRLLARHGELAYLAVLQEYPSRDGRFTQCLNYVEWQACAGLQRPLPVTLGQQLLVVGTRAGMVPPVDPRLIRAVDRHWLMVCRANHQAEFAKEEWPQVVRWMHDEKPVLDSNQWRSGWSTIRREFQKWTAIQSARGHWAPLLESFTTGPYTVTPLASAADLVREGWDMRHCAADYVGECRSGRYLMFSVARQKSHKRVATVGVRKAGKQWKVDQVSGKANLDPESDIHVVARLIKKYVREQEFRNNAERASRRLIRQVERTGHADIRVGWEGGGAPLMVLDDQAWQHIDLNQLPISEDLRERLRQWSARFQAFPPCHIIDDHDWNEMDDQLRGFAGELRCVLGPEYRVAG